MFTGIVEELGTVVATSADRLELRGPLVTKDVADGDSIAVNGVCLTVVSVAGDTFTADVMAETWRRSSLAELEPGDRVNLERAATLTSRLGGHLVQGHVDGVGTIAARTPGGAGPWPGPLDRGLRSAASAGGPGDSWDTVRFTVPPGLARYLVEKGSVTVDGVSLTVVETGPDWFTAGLIPTTLDRTTLGRKGVGAPLNVEVDVIAKYVEKLVGGAP
jgi:riboflavin synthase